MSDLQDFFFPMFGMDFPEILGICAFFFPFFYPTAGQKITEGDSSSRVRKGEGFAG